MFINHERHEPHETKSRVFGGRAKFHLSRMRVGGPMPGDRKVVKPGDCRVSPRRNVHPAFSRSRAAGDVSTPRFPRLWMCTPMFSSRWAHAAPLAFDRCLPAVRKNTLLISRVNAASHSQAKTPPEPFQFCRLPATSHRRTTLPKHISFCFFGRCNSGRHPICTPSSSAAVIAVPGGTGCSPCCSVCLSAKIRGRPPRGPGKSNPDFSIFAAISGVAGHSKPIRRAPDLVFVASPGLQSRLIPTAIPDNPFLSGQTHVKTRLLRGSWSFPYRGSGRNPQSLQKTCPSVSPGRQALGSQRS
jgi:hypothetical protein